MVLQSICDKRRVTNLKTHYRSLLKKKLEKRKKKHKTLSILISHARAVTQRLERIYLPIYMIKDTLFVHPHCLLEVSNIEHDIICSIIIYQYSMFSQDSLFYGHRPTLWVVIIHHLFRPSTKANETNFFITYSQVFLYLKIGSTASGFQLLIMLNLIDFLLFR